MMETLKAMFAVSTWEISAVDIGVMLGYMVLMMVVGWMCKGISKNISDYVRMGCKSTWWLMGTSIFMLMTSAGTFTGGAAQAYMSGWSFIWITASGFFSYLCMAAFFAPWMRRTRAVTPADALKLRYGPMIEQVNAYIGAVGGMLWGGVWLFAFAEFMAVVFNVPVPTVIIFVGIIVVFYSVAGGSWSVQITDTLQAYILVPIALVVLFLSLKEVGWMGGLMEGIRASGLQDDYKMVMEHGHVYKSSAAKIGAGYFTLGFIVAKFIYSFALSANVTSCWRFLSTKTDTDARKAALLAGTLLFFGSFVWFIPSMVGRVLYEDEIEAMGKHAVQVEETQAAETATEPAAEAAPEEAEPVKKQGLNNPADGAYALVAKKVLPPGLLGLVVIALLAATMSSLDSSLTGNAGIVTNNIYPALARVSGHTPWTGVKLLRLTQVVNLLLGAWAIILALLLWKGAGDSSVYDIGLKIILLVSLPMVLSMTLSFFVPWLPKWGPLVGMTCGFTGSLCFMFSGNVAAWAAEAPGVSEAIRGNLEGFAAWIKSLMWHHKVYINMGLTIIPTFATCLFWRTATDEYRAHVDNFFKQIHTPINFKEEVGESIDHSLMTIIGKLGLVIAGVIGILVFFAKDAQGNFSATYIFAVLFVVTFIATISGLMYAFGKRSSKRQGEAEMLG